MAKDLRDNARELLATGVDPSEQKKTIRRTTKVEEQLATATFKNIALEWLGDYSQRLTPAHATKLKGYLEQRF